MKVVSYYSLLGMILNVKVAWIVERDANDWKLNDNMKFILIDSRYCLAVSFIV